MSKHTFLGDISLPVGYYLKDGEKKRRSRTIGTLMQTEDERGTRQWMKLHADALSPSLLILCSKNGILEAGGDTIILNVYAPEERAPGAKSASAPAEEKGPF